jgi:hypothetical protein
MFHVEHFWKTTQVLLLQESNLYIFKKRISGVGRLPPAVPKQVSSSARFRQAARAGKQIPLNKF